MPIWCYLPWALNVAFPEHLSLDIEVMNSRNSQPTISTTVNYNHLGTNFHCTDFGQLFAVYFD